MHTCKEKKVNKKFKLIGKSTLDSRNRITLGGKILNKEPLSTMEVDSFETFVNNEGDILLCPLANIPSRELWVHKNPEVMKRLQKGFQAAKEGKVTRVKDLDKFFKEL